MSKSEDVKAEQLKNVYGEMSVDEKKAFYKDWAETYDAQTQGEFGYVGFETSAKEFSKRVGDKSASVLDAGCGTGLAGEVLAKEGFVNLDGADFSPEMLERAELTKAYNNLHQVDLTKSVALETQYDAIFSVGVFGFGPPYIGDLVHLFDVVKPGGLVFMTVNGKGWVDTNWEQELPKVIEKHQLNLEEQFEIPYLLNEGIKGIVLVFRA